MSLCILAAGKTTVLAVSAFTLSWTHSVEKTRWEEDWRVTPAGLEIVEARVKGSGAGMEPPEGAVLEGWVVDLRAEDRRAARSHAGSLGRDRRRLDAVRGSDLSGAWSGSRRGSRAFGLPGTRGPVATGGAEAPPHRPRTDQ